MAFQRGWNLDLSKCTGCHACEAACHKENNTPPTVKYRTVLEVESGTYPDTKFSFIPMACYHCADPACLAACPVDAITKDAEDGVVLIDQDKCIGCRYCEAACPYGAPRFNESTQKVEKCTYCKHRVGVAATPTLKPACVVTCVGEALTCRNDTFATGNEPTGFSKRSMTNPSIEFEKSFAMPHG